MAQSISFRNLAIVHGALLGGLVLLAGVAYYLNTGPGLPAEYSVEGGLMPWIVPAAVAAGVAMAYLVNRRRLAAAPAKASAAERWSHYRTTCFLRWGIVEGPVILSFLFFLLDEDWNYLLYGLAGLAFLALLRPARVELERYYRFSASELEQL